MQKYIFQFQNHSCVCRYGEVWGDWRGGDGGKLHQVVLDDEHINAVSLIIGTRIESIQFVTIKFNSYGPFGGSGGQLELSAHPECALSYISGTSGNELNSLTFHYEC